MELGDQGLSPARVEESTGDQQSAPNINDVLQAIEAADPSFREQAVEGAAVATAPGAMFGGSVHTGGGGGGGGRGGGAAPQLPTHDIYIRIVEQPATKALRFRYECEGRSAGSIPGAHSTADNKTYPTIEIVGYRGRAVVVVSCVTTEHPYKPHPHNLVGKDLCRDGVCTMPVNDTMTATFSNLGIQCVKKKDIDDALRLREKIRVDPFKTGFSHRNQPSSIDLNSVRLCFQVFLEQDGKFRVALPPVVSDIINDKKAVSELTINRMSHCSASVAGGQDVILLCEKVAKDNISVVLYELGEDGVTPVWSATADLLLVHKQVAIAFRTPRYHHMQVDRSIKAFVQLKRISDSATSEPRPFELTPVHSDHISRKRMKLLPYSTQDYANIDDLASRFDLGGGAARDQKPIKVEPRDAATAAAAAYGHTSPAQRIESNLNVYRNQTLTPSPVYHVPTPSPPVPHHYYDYDARCNILSEPQPGPSTEAQWNIPSEPHPGPSTQAHPPPHPHPPHTLPDFSNLGWPHEQPPPSSNLFPQSDVSLSNLLQTTDLRPLNSSDLDGISASLLQPDQDMTDSFSRLNTNNNLL